MRLFGARFPAWPACGIAGWDARPQSSVRQKGQQTLIAEAVCIPCRGRAGAAHFQLCKARGLCYTLARREPLRFRLFLGSSAVEHSTVNRMVAGSNPARGAKLAVLFVLHHSQPFSTPPQPPVTRSLFTSVRAATVRTVLDANMEPDAFLALDPKDAETIQNIKAIQYDIVCNGIELSSGAIRNHRLDVMKKAFGIAGYPEDVLEAKFGGMLRALSLGAPPHGGIAPGIDRIVMLLCGEENLREVVLFPMNQRAEDLMMGAPSDVTPKQLRELHIRLNLPANG